MEDREDRYRRWIGKIENAVRKFLDVNATNFLKHLGKAIRKRSGFGQCNINDVSKFKTQAAPLSVVPNCSFIKFTLRRTAQQNFSNHP